MPPESPAASWTGGWLAAARHCPSPNHGLRPDGAQIDLIVLHSISLPPGVYGEVRRFEANGCLVVTLAKAGTRRQP